MSRERVQRLRQQKENIRLEFKESRTDLPANLFKTICAMLNREGGDILLGVADDGTVQGVDEFYMEGDQRVSLRTKIFREIIAKLIVHREYTNAHPATFIIYKDLVETENANNPDGEGPIDPNNFAPFPKTPAIAKFFIQLGRVDELGPGVLNVNKYIREYSGSDSPQFIEGTTFQVIVPVSEGINHEVEGVNGKSEGVNVTVEGLNEGLKRKIGGVNEGLKSLFETVVQNPGIKAKDIPSKLSNRPLKTIERQIKELIALELIERQGSRKAAGYFVANKLTD